MRKLILAIVTFLACLLAVTGPARAISLKLLVQEGDTIGGKTLTNIGTGIASVARPIF